MGEALGRLEVICGPMFSGKTTELIRRATDAHTRGLTVRAFKPAADTRYADSALVTHAGGSFPARALPTAADLEAAEPGGVLAIDEAHFFGAPLLEPVLRLIAAGTRVILAGIERDHRGQPFEPFPSLLCHADEVLKLTGVCAACGGPAIHSQRLTPDPRAIVVGGRGQYEARCRRCFQPGP
jgi:thymidine kinase